MTSLDDYQFLPFYFGSSQLIGHRSILPKSVRSRDTVEAHADDYMYLACIKFIYDVSSDLLHKTLVTYIAFLGQIRSVRREFADFGLHRRSAHVGESQSRHVKDVQCRSHRQVPGDATLFVRIYSALPRARHSRSCCLANNLSCDLPGYEPSPPRRPQCAPARKEIDSRTRDSKMYKTSKFLNYKANLSAANHNG